MIVSQRFEKLRPGLPAGKNPHPLILEILTPLDQTQPYPQYRRIRLHDFDRWSKTRRGTNLQQLQPQINRRHKGLIEVIGPEKLAGGNNRNFWCIHPGDKLVLTPKDQQEDQSK